jgi:methyl-accepting chemotaxis protein
MGNRISAIAQNRIIRIYNDIIQHAGSSDETFISQKFKLDFIIKFSAAVLGGSLLFSGLILYYCHGTLTTSFENARLVLRKTSLSILPGVIYTSLIMLCLMAITATVLVIYISNNIRKPFFRFRENINAIAGGDLTTKVHYRSRDLTTVLAENINLMTLGVNAKVRDMEAGFRHAVETASEDAVPRDLAAELIRLHHGIKQDFIL